MISVSVVVLFAQPVFEDLTRLGGGRKVTFDVTESDLSSTADPPDGTGNVLVTGCRQCRLM